MIALNGINKTFKVAKRQGGLRQAVKALVSREYEEVHALKNISLHIKAGEMVGYIGPNGAGKSTTIKIMCGILTPDADSGSCVINGKVPWKERKAYVGEIGVVFGQRSQLWWDVPVIDSFELIRDIYKIPTTIYKRNVDELTTLLDLSEVLKTPARNLSLGQRMRCEIAASLLHNPKILFLDEPTIGLDAVSKIAVREFIKKQNATHQTTVILTTHDMQDIEALTDRVILIGKGQILLDDTLSQLKKRFSNEKVLTVDYSKGEITSAEGLTVIQNKDGKASVAVDTNILTVSQALSILSVEADIHDITVEGQSVDKIIVNLYKEHRI